MGGRGLGRVAGQRRALRSRDGHQVAFSQQVGAELQVVLEVKGSAGLEPRAERRQGGRLVELSHAAHAAELALRLRDVETRGSAIAAVGVVVGDGGSMRSMRVESVV